MQAIYKICCGIDVHKMKLVSCLKKGNKQEIREYGAKPKEIKEMCKWLKEEKCEMVAMESTASYWKPLYNIFELEGVNAIVVNSKDMKNVPGKKTDVKDAEWIADLLKHGLLKASYIPDREQRELREATRYRKSLTEERARELNRLQKMLEGANIKIASILSDVTSQSCRNLIDYVIENEDEIDIEKASKLVSKQVKARIEDIVDAMNGSITQFQKILIKEVLEHIDDMTKRIERMNKIVEEYMKKYEEEIKKLVEIPGIGKTSSQIILAEIGKDMARFPTEAHISSWCGLCPGNNESAGKRRSGKTRKGNKTLKSILVQCAKSAVKNKDTFYYAQYQRLMVRKGKNRATVAVAHSMLISIYYMLKNNVEYNDLGSNFYNQFNTQKKANSYIKKLEQLGYNITIN